jgi:hypothetical protein
MGKLYFFPLGNQKRHSALDPIVQDAPKSLTYCNMHALNVKILQTFDS